MELFLNRVLHRAVWSFGLVDIHLRLSALKRGISKLFVKFMGLDIPNF